MAFKVLIFAATLAIARAGLIGSAPAVATYSSAPAVSSAYFHQASAPVAVAHAAPVAYHAPAQVAYQSYQAPSPVAYQSYQAASPVAYHASAPAVAVAHSAPIVTAHSVHAPSVGYSEQNVARSLGGGQSVSTYSKAVDSAFSSVRKYDTRITNDALSLGHAPVSYSQPILAKSYAAPASYAYSAPLVTKSYAAQAPIAYSTPYVTKTYTAAPASLAYAAPAVTHYKTYGASAPVAYSTPLVTKSYAAGPVAYAQPAHLIAKQVSPVVSYAAAAPVVTKQAVSYSPAAVVAHTNFEGYGVEYHY